MAKPKLLGLQELASSEFSQGLFLNDYAQQAEPAFVADLCGPARTSNGLFLDIGWENSTFGLKARTDGWQMRTVTVGTTRMTLANYRDGLLLRDDDIRRDIHGVLSGVVNKFAVATKRSHWLSLLVAQLESSQTSPVDSATFFGSTHVLGGSAADRRNVFTKVQDSRLGVVDRTKPTALEMAGCFKAGIKGLFQIKDKNNDQPNADVSSFGVLVHSDVADVSQEACSRGRVLGTGGVEVANPLPDTFNLTCSHSARLGSAYDFYVWARGTSAKPIVRTYEYLPAGGEYQVTTEDGVRFTHHDMSVPDVQKSGEHNWLAEANRAIGFGDWFSIVKCTFANA